MGNFIPKLQICSYGILDWQSSGARWITCKPDVIMWFNSNRRVTIEHCVATTQTIRYHKKFIYATIKIYPNYSIFDLLSWWLTLHNIGIMEQSVFVKVIQHDLQYVCHCNNNLCTSLS